MLFSSSLKNWNCNCYCMKFIATLNLTFSFFFVSSTRERKKKGEAEKWYVCPLLTSIQRWYFTVVYKCMKVRLYKIFKYLDVVFCQSIYELFSCQCRFNPFLLFLQYYLVLLPQLYHILFCVVIIITYNHIHHQY